MDLNFFGNGSHIYLFLRDTRLLLFACSFLAESTITKERRDSFSRHVFLVSRRFLATQYIKVGTQHNYKNCAQASTGNSKGKKIWSDTFGFYWSALQSV